MSGSSDWVTVKTAASMGEAIAARSELEARGIPVFLPGENTKVFDPFWTGAGALTVEVQVPRGAATDALGILSGRYEELFGVGPDDGPGEGTDAELRALEHLGRRIGFAALMLFFAPIGLWLAVRYFRGVRRLGRRPRGHPWAVVSTLLCVLELVALVVLVAAE